MDENATQMGTPQPKQPQYQQPQYQQPQYQQPQYQQPQYQQPQYQQPQYQQPQYQQGYQPSQGKNGGMCLNDVALYSLSSAAKWIKTIGVIATIMMIMFAVFGIIMAIAIPKGYGALVLIPILIIIGIYLYPIIKSYSVGRNIKQAVMQNDENYLQEGLANMKSMFTYIGVLSIIGLVFFCIYMIIAIFGIINVANQASYHYY